MQPYMNHAPCPKHASTMLQPRHRNFSFMPQPCPNLARFGRLPSYQNAIPLFHSSDFMSSWFVLKKK